MTYDSSSDLESETGGLFRGGNHHGGGTVQLRDPAVTARCTGDLPLGEEVLVRLTEADVQKRVVRFALT